MVRTCPPAPFALFDDSLSPPELVRSLLLFDLHEALVCREPGELYATLSYIDAAAQAGYWICVEADYELGYWLEPKILNHAFSSTRPLLRAYVFRQGVRLKGNEVTELLAAHQSDLPAHREICGITDMQPQITQQDYIAAVKKILGYIAEGECYQVNYTFPLNFRHYGDPFVLYGKLRRAQPVRHGAYLQLPERTMLSHSPELFLERIGDRLSARPMKGTARRHKDPKTDLRLAKELAASEKNRAENLMIVDLIRNDLGRLARVGSVRLDRLFSVEAYPTVWQMTSAISADAPGRSMAEIFRALFPCGSVTGAPKIRSMQIIRELELSNRGIYTGTLGYVMPGGDFSFNVPIRTLTLNNDSTGSMGIGSGIVADSVPEAEFAECLLKAKFVASLETPFFPDKTHRMSPPVDRFHTSSCLTTRPQKTAELKTSRHAYLTFK